MELAEEEHEIVIVGAGICGLATALALHRKGLSSLVLERSDILRETGAAIGILSNGWRALDQLGVGDELRQKSVPIRRGEDRWIDEGKREEMKFLTGEARCLKRVDLIKALADALPQETIRFGSQILNIKMDPPNMIPTLRSQDGKSIRTKVLIGCDGSQSVVAQFLGLKPVKAFALGAMRGMTSYPSGHSFGHEFVRIRKNRTMMGRVPINDKLVFWFFVQPLNQFDGELPTDPKLIKALTLQSINGFPTEMTKMIEDSDLDSFSLTHLRYRPPWEILLGKFCKGTITVAGDAMHVMGPFLGQGGSAGLEDAVVLARNLAQKIGLGGGGYEREQASIGKAFHQYVEERRTRVSRLSMQTYLIGVILETASPLMKFAAIILMIILFSDQSAHTKYDCGHL